MRGLGGQAGSWRWRAALVLAVATTVTTPARAEGGFFGFLSAALGGGSQQPAAAPAPAPSEGEQVRPLTVRRTPKKVGRTGAGRTHMVRVPTKMAPVSIYQDPTLRNGDAVMTRSGMKVFAGGRLSSDKPFDDTDFVAVSASKSVAPNLRKTVIELNKLPHG